jgi:hypothetical protein
VKERCSGTDIVDLITLPLRVQFRSWRCQNVLMITNPTISAAIATAAPDTGQTQALGRRIGGIVEAATESKAAVISSASPMLKIPMTPRAALPAAADRNTVSAAAGLPPSTHAVPKIEAAAIAAMYPVMNGTIPGRDGGPF